ncbi:MAG: FkbM family methyltransferase [Rhodomicrobium sp.]
MKSGSKIERLMNFASTARNVFSQFGEDGIIETILDLLPQDGWCVEFGAWDGVYLSNTCNLIRNHGYRGVLIEADSKRFEQLTENITGKDNVLLNRYVTFDGEGALSKILANTDIPKDFDFLSIDIDGNDYHIFESLTEYRSKLVCIEFNPSIPNPVFFVQVKDFRIKQGASARAITELAQSKGYELVASTYCNLLLVDKIHMPRLGLSTGLTLEQCRDDNASRYYLFCGYDGTLFCDRPFPLTWHHLTVTPTGLQALPTFLRGLPDDYNSLQRSLFKLWRSLGRRRDKLK